MNETAKTNQVGDLGMTDEAFFDMLCDPVFQFQVFLDNLKNIVPGSENDPKRYQEEFRKRFPDLAGRNIENLFYAFAAGFDKAMDMINKVMQ